MIERQRVDQRPETQPARALRDRGEKDARRRGEAERRRMMLGDVIGVEAEPVVGFDDLQPGLVVVTKREIVAVEMIEDAELHSTKPQGTHADDDCEAYIAGPWLPT